MHVFGYILHVYLHTMDRTYLDVYKNMYVHTTDGVES